MQYKRANSFSLIQRNVNRMLSLILNSGVIIALVTITAGLVMYSFKGINEVEKLVPLPLLSGKLVELSPSALITVGLIMMLLLPQIVILVSFIYFIAAGQKKPAITCAISLMAVIISIVILNIMK